MKILKQLGYYFKSKVLAIRKLYLIIQKLPVLQVCLGLSVGFVLGTTMGINSLPWLLLLVLLLRKRLILVGLFGLVGLIYCAANNYNLPAIINYELGESHLTVRVVESPQQKSFSDSMVVEVNGKRFILEVPKFSGYELGNELKIQDAKFENLTGYNAGYALYLASRQIYGVLSSGDVQLIENHINLVKTMSEVRSELSGVIKHNLLPPESDLLEGILVGEKASLSPEFKEDLQISGLMHVVAVSGFNVMLIANFLGFLCGIIPRKIVYILTLIVIWLFLFLVGVENLPAQRAVIMLTIMYAGLLIGRRVPMLLCMLYASTLMLIANPLVWMNISWQLSFAAMLGVVIFSNILSRFFNTASEFGSNLITTIAVILTTGPISFLSFGSFSLVGLLSNMLIVPFVPIITILGFISLAGSAVGKLANILFQLVDLVLKIVVEFIRILGELGEGVVTSPLIALTVILGIGLVILSVDFKLFVRSVEDQYAKV